jgi:hypothetical protein
VNEEKLPNGSFLSSQNERHLQYPTNWEWDPKTPTKRIVLWYKLIITTVLLQSNTTNNQNKKIHKTNQSNEKFFDFKQSKHQKRKLPKWTLKNADHKFSEMKEGWSEVRKGWICEKKVQSEVWSENCEMNFAVAPSWCWRKPKHTPTAIPDNDTVPVHQTIIHLSHIKMIYYQWITY